MQALVAGNTAFACDLYKQLRSEPNNLFISPLSISMALGMCWAGAAGSTETQMREALHLSLSQQRYHPAANALDLALESRGSNSESASMPFALTNVNALWAALDFTFRANYLDVLARNYGAGVQRLDFASRPDESRITINSWVEERTNDRIKDLLPQGSIKPFTALVLTNAIYFRAQWASPFDSTNTHSLSFSLPGHEQIAVPTMQQTLHANYTATTDYQAIELPYKGKELAMVVILPADLASFESTLDATELGAITQAMSSSEVQLSLPRFAYTSSSLRLNKSLQNMGMTAAFSDAADFSGISEKRKISISEVLHKAFVAVGEQGTEAAAATAVVLVDSAMLNPQIKVMAVNRPFFFFIRDVATGAILFMGRINDPR
jgi:serpin B